MRRTPRTPLVVAVVAVAAALLTLLSSAGTPATASAETSGTRSTVSRAYSAYRMAWVSKFNLCMAVYVTGTMKATRYTEPVEGGAWVRISHPRIVDPSMQVTLKESCDDNAEVKRYHRASTISLKSYYYGFRCSYTPTYSVGAPWSVGVGVTPDCGEKKVARLGDHQVHARRAYRFDVSSDGQAFSWKANKSDTAPTRLKLCTSLSAYFALRDTEGTSRSKAYRKVGFPDACVTT